MLEHLDQTDGAHAVVNRGTTTVTPDLGGKASTAEAARGLVREPVIIRGHRPGDSDPVKDLRRRARAQASRISRPAR